jgi:hypothetical protein
MEIRRCLRLIDKKLSIYYQTKIRNELEYNKIMTKAIMHHNINSQPWGHYNWDQKVALSGTRNLSFPQPYQLNHFFRAVIAPIMLHKVIFTATIGIDTFYVHCIWSKVLRLDIETDN